MYKRLWQQLTTLYGEGEAKGIVRLLLEVRFGLTWTDIVCGKADELSADDQAALKTMMQRLEQGEPVQYVVGMAEFGGRMFHVEPGVLIPRPETYELCEWIIEEKGEIFEEKGKRREERDYHILDVGTGSGCIACTLAAEMPEVRGARVAAWDISEEALAVAQKNAKLMGVEVRFEKQDALCLLEERGERRDGTSSSAIPLTSATRNGRRWSGTCWSMSRNRRCLCLMMTLCCFIGLSPNTDNTR